MNKTRDLPRRMLAAVEARVNMNSTRPAGSVIGQKKAQVRLNESSEILGILRNVVAAWEAENA